MLNNTRSHAAEVYSMLKYYSHNPSLDLNFHFVKKLVDSTQSHFWMDVTVTHPMACVGFLHPQMNQLKSRHKASLSAQAGTDRFMQ